MDNIVVRVFNQELCTVRGSIMLWLQQKRRTRNRHDSIKVETLRK